MKDVRQLSNFDPKSEPFKAALRDFRRIIRDEILKLLTRLFYSIGFAELYRGYTGRLDYKAFQQKLLQSLEAERAKEDQGDESRLPFIFRAFSEIHSEIDSPEIHQINSQQEHKDFFGLVYHLIGSPDYSPPTEWKDLVTHLVCLFISWDLHSRTPELHEDFSPFSDMILLLSFSKLLGASYELFANYTMKGERELMRTKKSTKAKKEDTDKRKGFVIAIYDHGKRIEAGTKFNRACSIIQTQFDKSRGNDKAPWGIIPKDPEEIKTPSLASIDRWLKEAGIRDRDFKPEGRYWIKQA